MPSGLSNMWGQRKPVTAREIALFGLCAGLMLAGKKVMEPLPNIHPVGLMIVVMTVLFRARALYPLYTYILLEGLLGGFGTWWIPYLYVWVILWAGVMLLPRNLPPRLAPLIYGLICGLHGLAFGALYAPAQALLYGLNFKTMLMWIASGFPYDCIHGVANFVLAAVLSVPLIRVGRRAMDGI